MGGRGFGREGAGLGGSAGWTGPGTVFSYKFRCLFVQLSSGYPRLYFCLK